MSNIYYSINSLIKITALILMLTLIIRNFFIGNLVVMGAINITLGIFAIWFFTKKFNIKIIIFTFLSIVLTILSEIISATFVQKYLHSISDNISWWLTGIPHIVILILIPIIKRGQLICTERKAGISEMQ
ncbi:hypothetical protein [Desulforamulus ferrireducens]|uniref:hypothetical protein n=1 Tax=Desulforamulus ferrireducens TaxID=1833852 RepID=UPI001A9A3F04|nr:hypothetical protein [Desulforamulus ferrireducens]